ncbi:MAG: endolytic transglycosylase MltG, partial [Chloroflexota bacterium]
LRAVATGRYDYPFLRDRPAGSSLEGYLFPDTYHIAGRPSAEALVGMMLEGFGQRFTPAMRQQAAERKLTIHQAVTVASLVEREAQAASERPIIAAIYLKRWATGMPLEADATVQYAIGYRAETKLWWNPLQLGELRTVQSPYNTYLNPGLPPGPICSPGLASLQAVLQPAKTDFLYYYSKGDGTHAFARSFEEHLENQKKYQK